MKISEKGDRLRKIFLFCMLTIMLPGCSLSPMSWNMWGPVNKRSGVAMSGYDVVAYRTDGSASKGSEKFTYRWKDAEWRFASEENRKYFSGDPARYAPEYGGYCAYSASKGITFYGDPEYWEIRDDRLFFFFNNYTRSSFDEEIDDGVIERADANWKHAYPEMP